MAPEQQQVGILRVRALGIDGDKGTGTNAGQGRGAAVQEAFAGAASPRQHDVDFRLGNASITDRQFLRPPVKRPIIADPAASAQLLRARRFFERDCASFRSGPHCPDHSAEEIGAWSGNRAAPFSSSLALASRDVPAVVKNSEVRGSISRRRAKKAKAVHPGIAGIRHDTPGCFLAERRARARAIGKGDSFAPFAAQRLGVAWRRRLSSFQTSTTFRGWRAD